MAIKIIEWNSVKWNTTDFVRRIKMNWNKDQLETNSRLKFTIVIIFVIYFYVNDNTIFLRISADIWYINLQRTSRLSLLNFFDSILWYIHFLSKLFAIIQFHIFIRSRNVWLWFIIILDYTTDLFRFRYIEISMIKLNDKIDQVHLQLLARAWYPEI